jgi:hypothetical protein
VKLTQFAIDDGPHKSGEALVARELVRSAGADVAS